MYSDDRHFPTANDDAEIRVGIAYSTATDYAFYNQVLKLVLECSFTRPVVKICLENPGLSINSTVQGQSTFTNWFAKLDGKLKSQILQAHRDSVHSILDDLPTIKHDCLQDLSDASHRKLVSLDLDVILECSPSTVMELASISRYGIWHFNYLADENTIDTRDPLARALNDELISQIGLLARQAISKDTFLLAQTTTRKPDNLSLTNIAKSEGEAAAELLIWEIWKLISPGGNGVMDGANRLKKHPALRPTPRSSISLAWLLARKLTRRLARKIKRTPKPREWTVGLRKARNEAPWSNDWKGFNWLDVEDNHYLADPFIFQNENGCWLFVEDFDSDIEKGRITCAPVSSEGAIGQWRTVLDLPYHLSYPLVFEYDNDVFMIPESHESGSVNLYRANEFPFVWSKVRTLWNGPGLDTVPLFSADGTWYFFASVQNSKAAPPQLLLFTATDLESDWQLHPMNPISLDVRYSRNGGRILKWCDQDGTTKLIRVSQDGAGGYGSKLHFHEIDCLTTNFYSERYIGSRFPPSDRVGSHHYERSDSWEVVDVS